MRDSTWLIVNRRGIVKVVKGGRRAYGTHGPRETTRPALEQGEAAIFLTVEVPDSAFNPRPSPEATIVVPETALLAPPARVTVEPAPADPDALEADPRGPLDA